MTEKTVPPTKRPGIGDTKATVTPIAKTVGHQGAQPGVKIIPIKWDYYSVVFDHTDDIRAEGLQGWELVSVFPHPTRGGWYEAWFKRPVS